MPPAPPPSLLAPTSSAPKKLVMSKQLVQGDDTEVTPMSIEAYRKAVEDWIGIENDGEEPDENEECTGDMLACLDHRISNGGTPHADFGIWRPFGHRLDRALKFTVHTAKVDGTHQPKEINGPASFDDWNRSWRVFVFAMGVLKQAPRTRLNKYFNRISELNELYPQHWWALGLADIIMRREHLEKVRRRCIIRHAKGELADFNIHRPLDVGFREAAADQDFWNKHVGKKILRMATSITTAEAESRQGYGHISEAGSSDENAEALAALPSKKMKKKTGGGSGGAAPVHGEGKSAAAKQRRKKRLGSGGRAAQNRSQSAASANQPRAFRTNDKLSDGRWKTSGNGVGICWEWARSAAGCR